MKTAKNIQMKKMHRGVILLFVFLVFIQVLCIGVLGNADEKCYVSQNISEALHGSSKVEYLFRPEYAFINSLGVVFDGVMEDASGYLDIRINKEAELLWAGKLSLNKIHNNVREEIYIGSPLEKDKNYSLQLYAEGEDVSIETLDIKYGDSNENVFLFRMMKLLPWLIVDILVLLCLFYRNRLLCLLKKYRDSLLESKYCNPVVIATQILCSLLLVTFLEIEFNKSTIGLLLIISWISGYKFKEKIMQLKQVANIKYTKIILSLLILFAAFCFCGNYTIILPIGKSVTLLKIILFMTSIIWMTPIIITMILLFISLSDKLFDAGSEKKSTVCFFVVNVILLLWPSVLAMYAFNPVISTGDSIDCIWSAHHIVNSSDWFPPFYYMFLRSAFMIWDHVTMAAIQQMLFWCVVFMELFLFMRKHGIKDKYIYICSFFIGINVNNFLYLNTIWKDIPYCCAIVWLTVVLAKLFIDKEEYENKVLIYLELICALVFTYFLRKNGVIPCAMVMLALLYVFKRKWKIYVSLVISVLVILFIQFPLYSYLQIEKASSNSMYLGLGQDILGTYYAGGELSEESIKFVTKLTKENNIEHEYNPTYYPYSHNNEMEVEIGGFARDVVETALRNPMEFIRNSVARMDVVFSVFRGNKSIVTNVNYYGTEDEDIIWNTLAPQRIENELTFLFERVCFLTISNQILNIVTWRCGIYTLLLGVIYVTLMLRSKKMKYSLLFMPVLGQVLGLWIACGWCGEYRYFWPINVICVVLIMLTPILIRVQRTEMQGKGI